jgi:cytochrome c oxidase cbb3-type subunit III
VRSSGAQLLLVTCLAACEREERDFTQLGAAPTLPHETILTAGDPPVGGTAFDPSMPDYKETAAAISEGKTLYSQFNCVGCHARGGGAIGPAFLDGYWIYGSSPAAVATTIIAGRKNGMPSYRGKIVQQQLYSLVAYVRSLGGLVRGDAVAPRDDHMQAAPITNLNESGWPIWPKERP